MGLVAVWMAVVLSTLSLIWGLLSLTVEILGVVIAIGVFAAAQESGSNPDWGFLGALGTAGAVLVAISLVRTGIAGVTMSKTMRAVVDPTRRGWMLWAIIAGFFELLQVAARVVWMVLGDLEFSVLWTAPFAVGALAWAAIVTMAVVDRATMKA